MLVEGFSLKKKIRTMAENPRELSQKKSWKEKDLGVMYTVRSVGIRC